jgi:hypothetical protein
MERRVHWHCRVRASLLACSRAGHLHAGHKIIVLLLLHITILLVSCYYLINTILLQNYFSITTTLLPFHYYILLHDYFYITTQLLHDYFIIFIITT